MRIPVGVVVVVLITYWFVCVEGGVSFGVVYCACLWFRVGLFRLCMCRNCACYMLDCGVCIGLLARACLLLCVCA